MAIVKAIQSSPLNLEELHSAAGLYTHAIVCVCVTRLHCGLYEYNVALAAE